MFRNKEGMTPLGAASSKGHIKVVQLLIDEGVEINPDFKEDQIISKIINI